MAYVLALPETIKWSTDKTYYSYPKSSWSKLLKYVRKSKKSDICNLRLIERKYPKATIVIILVNQDKDY